ncbi:protein translocase subunit SecF [Candidatus Beckwithbacteria bacterium]|nr:protein translocase subunit SecF [Candidatus Beckwithbacteria bacterium]
MKYYWVYFIFSSIFIVPGIYSLLNWGLKPSIDFTGGTVLQLQVNSQKPIQKSVIEAAAKKENIEILELNQSTNNTFTLRAKEFNQSKNTLLQEKIASAAGATVTEKQFETLGPILGSETLNKTMAAIGLAVIVILLFVWKQFNDKKYGICAILAMLHDTLVVFGIFSLLGHFKGVEIDTLFMTAVLTILSFSVHDTIVVYDRIRESLRKYSGIPYETIVNKAVNETLGRSVNNSMTIIFMLLALYLLGGETIKWFVFALLIGTISGTYSSTFTAAPLLVLWEKMFKRSRH